MPSVTHTNEELETSQQSMKSEDAQSNMSKEDEDKMIDNILAKHGIKLGEKTSSDAPAVKDSADRILDNIDAQLGDVKIKSLAKKPASVNGDVTEYAVDQNYNEHTDSLTLHSSSYGYKARSLNDLSRTSVNDEDTYFSQGLSRRPLTARKAREPLDVTEKPKDDSEKMPLLSMRDLSYGDETYLLNSSLPSTIPYYGSKSSYYTPHYRSYQDIATTHSTPTKPPDFRRIERKKFITSTPFNVKIPPKQITVSGQSFSEKSSSYKSSDPRSILKKRKVEQPMKYEEQKETNDVDELIPSSEILKKQEEYEWRLKKMLKEQEVARNEHEDSSDLRNLKNEVHAVSSVTNSSSHQSASNITGEKSTRISTSSSTHEVESVRTEDLLENADKFVSSEHSSYGNQIVDLPSASSVCSSSADRSAGSLQGTYKIKDYHLVPEYYSFSGKVTSGSVTSDSIDTSKSALSQTNAAKVYKARSAVSERSGNSSSSKSHQNENLEEVGSMNHASKNSSYVTNPESPIADKSFTKMFENSRVSCDSNDDEAEQSVESFANSEEINLTSFMKEQCQNIAQGYVENHLQFQEDEVGSKSDENLERTLTPTPFNGSEEEELKEDVVDSLRSASTSTLCTEEVPDKLRDSLVGLTSDERSSLEFTLHVSSTDLESLPTSEFEENWLKRQKTRFPELTPADSALATSVDLSIDSPRTKKKLTKRERMKKVLSTPRSAKQSIFSSESSSNHSHDGTNVKITIHEIINIESMSMTTEDLICADSTGFDETGSNSSRGHRPNSVASFNTTQTEDFEDRYRQMMVRHVAGVPLTSFDNVTIASDLDSVKTDTVHQHFVDSMRRNKSCDRHDNGVSNDDIKQKLTDHDRSRHLREKFKQLKSSQDVETSDSSSDHRPPSIRNSSRGSSYDRKSENADGSHRSIAEPRSRADDSLFVNNSRSTSRSTALPDYHRNSSRGSGRMQASGLSTSSSNRRSQSQNRLPDTQTRGNADRSSGKTNSDYYESQSARRHSRHSSYTSGTTNDDRTLQRTSSRTVELDRDVKDLEEKKNTKLNEVAEVEQTLEKHRINLLKLEEKMRENQSKADDARAELMVLEFKRDQAKSDLEKANSELVKVNDKLGDVNEEQVISYDEMIALIQERDELKARIRRGEASALTIQERQELERALHLSKEELFRERKLGRQRSEDLEEKVEEVEHNFEIMESEKNAQISRLEADIQKMKKEFEKSKAATEPPTNRSSAIEVEKKQLYDQIDEMKIKINNKDKEIVSLATDNNKKREQNEFLQKQISDMESKLNDDLKLREKLIAETEKQIANIKKDKERSLSLFENEKSNLSKQNEREIENAKEKAVLEIKLEKQDEIAKLKAAVEMKQREIERLNDQLQQQHETSKTLADKLKKDAQDQVRTAVVKERCLLDQERDSSNRRVEEARREAMEKERFRMQQEVDEARGRCKTSTEQIAKLSKEIDDQRQMNRDLHQEKLEAAAKAQEECLHEQKKKNDQLKKDLEDQMQSEVAQYRNKIRKLEDDLRKIKQEKNDAQMKCNEATSNYDRLERTISGDISEECTKLLDLINGIRTPSQTRSRGSSIASRSNGLMSRNRSSNSESAIAHLRGVSDEVRATMRDLTTEVETHKRAAQITQRELDRAQNSGKSSQANLHLNDLNGHSDDVLMLKQKLSVKDEELRDIQRSMSSWKDATAQRLAHKFEEELELQIERRMGRQRIDYQRKIDQLEAEIARNNTVNLTTLGHPITDMKMTSPIPGSSSTPVGPGKVTSPGGSPGQTSTVKLLRHLQGRVKQLRAENDLLRSSTQISDFDSYRVGR